MILNIFIELWTGVIFEKFLKSETISCEFNYVCKLT